MIQVLSFELSEIFYKDIVTGVSFRKILGFYYKRKRQLFYYEGTSSNIPLKIPERLNGVISQNSFGLLLQKILQQTKD